MIRGVSGRVKHMDDIPVLSKWPVPLYLVGGCVRDSLLGLPIKDRDVCSSLLPYEVLGWCKEHSVRAEITNESHLVVTLRLGGETIEHTTFRRESDYDGVHAGTVEPSSMEEDAFRRDLTINALYKEWGTDKVIDLVGGLSDLGSKTLRLISSDTYGNEFTRLWEHGGRLFRLARFASSKFKGWDIHPDTLDACRNFSGLVLMEGRGKWESFGEEWAKAGYTYNYLVKLHRFGFLHWYGLELPSAPGEWFPHYPWYSLWGASYKPDLKTFQSMWRLPNDVVLTIKDLELGKGIQQEWEWRTTKFRRLSAMEVATFWGKSFRVLDIPTQGEIAQLVGRGPQVTKVWVEKVKERYLSN